MKKIKKILFSVPALFLYICVVVWAAQQTIVSTDTLNQAWTKQNSNNAEYIRNDTNYTPTAAVDLSQASSNTTGPTVYTASAAEPDVDGKIKIVSGVNGWARNIFAFFSTTVQYILSYDTLPTVDGSVPTYNASNDDIDWTVPSGSTPTEVSATPDPWDMDANKLYVAQDDGEISYKLSDSSSVFRYASTTTTPLYDLTLSVVSSNASTIDINGTSYGNGGPYTISSLTGSVTMDAVFDVDDTLVWSGADSGDVTGTDPYAITMSAYKTLVATFSGAAQTTYYVGFNNDHTTTMIDTAPTQSGASTDRAIYNFPTLPAGATVTAIHVYKVSGAPTAEEVSLYNYTSATEGGALLSQADAATGDATWTRTAMTTGTRYFASETQVFAGYAYTGTMTIGRYNGSNSASKYDGYGTDPLGTVSPYSYNAGIIIEYTK